MTPGLGRIATLAQTSGRVCRGWSPRQLGELADTSRRTVRHYEEIGLLAEPQRQSNGYRQYGVAHLIRLLRIRRLTQLGFTLTQIESMGSADEHPAQHLRDLDAELATRVEHLQQTRRELATMLDGAAPTDLPPEVAHHAAGLPPTERALLVVLSRVLEPDTLEAYVDLLPLYRQHPAVEAFDNLTPDSDERRRKNTAAGIVSHLGHLSAERPESINRVRAGLRSRSRHGSLPKHQVIEAALEHLYNAAQLDVLARVRRQVHAGQPVLARAG